MEEGGGKLALVLDWRVDSFLGEGWLGRTLCLYKSVCIVLIVL